MLCAARRGTANPHGYVTEERQITSQKSLSPEGFIKDRTVTALPPSGQDIGTEHGCGSQIRILTLEGMRI